MYIWDDPNTHPAALVAAGIVPCRGRKRYPLKYTRGQVSVNKRISVLSNYFDVSFEIYYVRLKSIDSIGQVVKSLILRPASIYCTFKPGHVGSLER